MLKWVTNESPSLRSKRNTIIAKTSGVEQENPTDSRAEKRRTVLSSKQLRSTKQLIKDKQAISLNRTGEDLTKYLCETRKLPAKIEMLLNNTENVLPSAGVVFLQYVDDVKRVHLPVLIPSIGVLENLFINAYPGKITRKHFSEGLKVIYIKDVASGTFYELEKLEEVLNLSWLKIHDRIPVGNQVHIPDDVKSRRITHLERTSKNKGDHQQPRSLSRLRSGGEDYGNIDGPDLWDYEEEHVGSLKRSSAVTSKRKNKSGAATNKGVTWNSSSRNAGLNETSNQVKVNQSTAMKTNPEDNNCDPDLLQKSVETELESLTALLTSAFDNDEDEEHVNDEIVFDEGGKEYVNIKSPGRLDPRFLDYIESEARNAVFARRNTLPKYYKPTIIVAAQEESRRRKSSGRSDENDEVEASQAKMTRTKTPGNLENDKNSQTCTDEIDGTGKLPTKAQNGTCWTNDMNKNDPTLFEFQNIETDERGEPKVNPSINGKHVLPTGQNSTMREDILDDEVFETSGDALTAVVESLLHATETETKTEDETSSIANTDSEAEPFVRSMPLRNTFPKYYKPNIIIQTTKKDPNETNAVVVAKTNPYSHKREAPGASNIAKTLTSVKMKMGRNSKKVVEKSEEQNSADTFGGLSNQSVSSLAFQLNSTDQLRTTRQKAEGEDVDTPKSNKEHSLRRVEPSEGNSISPIPPHLSDKEMKRKTSLRDSLVIKDLLERYGPKKAKKKELKNGMKEITMTEEMNQKSQTNDKEALEMSASKNTIIEPGVSQLISQIMSAERDVSAASRNPNHVTSGCADKDHTIGSHTYVNERILPLQNAQHTLTDHSHGSADDVDHLYAKISKPTPELSCFDEDKNFSDLENEDTVGQDTPEENTEIHYATIKEVCGHRVNHEDLSKSAKYVQESLRRLRHCLREMRCAHREGVRSFEEDMQEKMAEFRRKASRLDIVLKDRLDTNNSSKVTFARDTKGAQQKRYGLSKEQKEYVHKMSDTETRLSNLENDMETFRTTVTIRKCMESPEILNDLHEELTLLTKGLADIKARFHSIRDQLKHIIPEELQIISGEERFLREEPQKLQDYVGRCKALSRTLFTLGELVNVQAELDNDVMSGMATAGTSDTQSSGTPSTSDGVVTTTLHLPRQKRKK